MPSIESFCREVYPGLVGALRLQSGDPELAEDLAQEALARAWERWEEVGAMEDPKGWVFRVAYNLAVSAHRRRAVADRWRRLLRPAPALDETSADGVAVRDALMRLPERQRAAVALRYYLDLSVDETASVMGCAEGTVKSLCHKARMTMQSALAVDEEGDSRE